MTPDDARKLLGGYATGSLTEAERKALSEAALEDQDLFDELAGEQVLKEVLDEPGARQRLLAALESRPHRIAWWMRPWPWAAAAATLAVLIGVVIFNRTPPPEPPQQIAQVLKSPEPAAAPVAPQPAAPAPLKQNVASGPPPPPVPELQKAEAENKAADQVQEAKPQAAGAVRQFAPAAPKAAAAPAQNETVTVTETIGPVEFTYAIGTDGFLQIVTVEAGFVSVAAEFTDRDDVIYPSNEVTAKATIRIQIPANATGFIIGFSKMPGVNNARIGRPLVPGLGFDPNPPNGRFRIQVPATVITPPSLTPAPR